MQDILELHEFFVEGGSQERSHVLLHISEPDVDEKNKGYFFAVCEINNGSPEQIEHLQQMIDDLESGYYETEDEADKNAFELTLEYINRRGHHVLQSNKNSLTNCIVGVLRGHDIFFAYHGQPQVVLFYPGKESLENLNVLAEQEDGQDNQLFSAMLSGNVNAGDYFYVASPHVNDFFTTDRISKIIFGRTTHQTADHMQKVLTDLKNDLSFGGILFHFPTKNEVPMTGKQPKNLNQQSSASSLDELLNKEKFTEETLSPSFLGNWKKSVAEKKLVKEDEEKRKRIEKQHQEREKVAAKFAEANRRAKEPKEPLLNIILVSVGRTLVTGLLGLWHFLKFTAILLGKTIIGLILLISNKDNKRAEVLRTIRNAIYKKQEQFSDLPLLSKIILCLTLILAFIFVGSLIYLKIKQANQEKVQTYNSQVQAIIDKKNAADASLLYNDENKAMVLLQEAKQIINSLPAGSKTEKQKTDELNASLDAGLTKLRKITYVKPELLADLTQIKKTALADKLTILDNTLIAYGSTDPGLYKIKTIGGQSELQDHGVVPHLFNASTPKEQDMVVFISGDASIAEYFKDTSIFKNADISFPRANPKISALAIYSRKLYLIDKNNNQIYKHSLTQTGFDKGIEWLKDKTVNLQDAISLALDGDVFVLKQNGELLKFASGLKQPFAIQGLDPKLTNPAQIWTYNGVNNLYILEPTNKRLIVLDKTGKLIKQYVDNNWQAPSSMIVDETKKTAYVLDSNKVYKINL